MKPKKLGRPALQKRLKMVRVLITIDHTSMARARKLGHGNLSAGIRKALTNQKRRKT